MTTAYKKLEELANCISDAHKELAGEIEKICEEDGVSEDHHPLHHSAQNILRLERLLGELVKAMASEEVTHPSLFDSTTIGVVFKSGRKTRSQLT